MPGHRGRGRRGHGRRRGGGCHVAYGGRPSRSHSRDRDRRWNFGHGRGGHHSPGRHSPGRHSPGRHSPGRHSPGRHSPGRHSPGRHSPGRHSPGRHSPGRHSPGRHSPGRVSPGRCPTFPFRPNFTFPGGHFGGRLPPWILPIGPGRGPCRERPTVVVKPEKTEEPDKGEEIPQKDERPPTPEIPTEEVQKNLHVTEIDLQILTNGKTHHTDLYDLVEEGQKLVIRRGENFRFSITLNQIYNPTSQKIRVVFEIGQNPAPGKGSFARIPLNGQAQKGTWRVKLEEQTDKTLHLLVTVPANCIIGKWKMSIETKETNKTKWLKRSPEKLYILFNPWCKDDIVYMENEKELEEYVLNDSGCIYTGNAKQINPKPWNFGQFEEGILEAAMYVISKGLNWQFNQVRADPVRVSRVIAQLVNSNDDEGVVYGNWSGVYDDGTAPTFWSGSVKILEEYMARKKPVKYGQCWVYAGVTTTVCRALGIPSRCVSNFQSAHDTDGNITIDSYFTVDEGTVQPVNEMNEDSVWNFHVWNEAYMVRPDLNNELYNGWQVIDATPQEASDGLFCCGPAPVAAIKSGDIGVSFDAAFVFAEVNADKVLWIETPDGDFKVFQMKKDTIGKKISTKDPDGQPFDKGQDQRMDITDTYKYPEGMDEERAAVIRASLNVTTERSAYNQPAAGVDAEITFSDDLMVGDDFEVKVKLSNTSTDDLVVGYVRLQADSIYYIGAVAGEIKTEEHRDIQLNAGETVTLVTSITKEEYLPHIAELNGIHMRVVGMVTGTDQYFVSEEDMRLETPKLHIEMPAKSRAKQPFKCTIRLTNPLPVSLTNGNLSLEGPGIWKTKNIKIDEIRANSTWEKEVTLKPKRRGKKQLVASFDCEQLQDVNGSAVIHVTAAK